MIERKKKALEENDGVTDFVERKKHKYNLK